MSVRRAQHEISSSEFVEWMARDELPGMHSREDLRTGIVAAVVANVNRDPRRRSTPFYPADFYVPEEPEETTDDVLLARAIAWQTSINAGRRD